MGNRLAQILLLLLALVFAFASLDAFTEPWSAMNEAVAAETVCSHLVGLALAILCFRAAMHFGSRAAFSTSRRIREPQL